MGKQERDTRFKVDMAEESDGAQERNVEQKNQSIAESNTTLKALQWGINLAENIVRHIQWWKQKRCKAKDLWLKNDLRENINMKY